ncbi:MAG: GNAT family N-acetyltransferase [Leptospiraceae bacterium]|nr:GNAT family N-acetyltransferase [Leptospiraceae bacterium]
MFSIKEINKDAIEDISALLQRNYNYETVNYFKAHFVWVFSNDKYKIIGAYEGNQLIALRPAIGWNLSMNRKRLCLYQLTGTIVHEDFRRQGLFSKTNKYFIANAHESMGFIFNISVKNSRLGYEKLGWKYLNGFHRLTKVLPTNYFKKSNDKSESIFKISDQKLITYLSNRESQFEGLIHTEYNIDFYKWRLTNKKNEYLIFEIDNIGLVVYKLNVFKEKKELVIGEIFLKNNSYYDFRLLIKALLKKEKPVLSTVYIFENHPYYNYYLCLMFIPNYFNYNLNFGVKELKEDISEKIFDNKLWALSSLDLDTF